MWSIFNSKPLDTESYSGYTLDDKWSPDFDSELKLAVASFHADDAFHRVFGEGRQLDEKSITWHFIGLIVNRRFNAISHLVTVRKDDDLKAAMAGTFNIKPPMLKQFINHIKQERILNKINPYADADIKPRTMSEF